MAKRKLKKNEFIGDKFVLAQYHLTGPYPTILESSDELADVYAAVAEQHNDDFDDDTIGIYEVVNKIWKRSSNDPSDTNPVDLRCISQITFYESPTEEDEEDG